MPVLQFMNSITFQARYLLYQIAYAMASQVAISPLLYQKSSVLRLDVL